MLIRRPAAEVFNAFVDPAVTARFWFSRGSGKLEAGGAVQWFWDIMDQPVDVRVLALEPDKRILMEWGMGGEMTNVEWNFTARPDGTTFVSVTESGFQGDGDAVVSRALDSTSGFALVLMAGKAFLEHGIDLHIVADRFPDGIEK